MIRDLVEVAVRLVKEEKIQEVSEKAKNNALNKITDALMKVKKDQIQGDESEFRKKLFEDVASGKCDSEVIEIAIAEQLKPIGIMPGMGGGDLDIGNVIGSIFPPQRRTKKITVEKAYKLIMSEESDKLIDKESVNSEAIRRAEQEGIVFIDEIDKIAGRSGASKGPDVSREGVQRDILPLVEGCTVTTKYGTIKTDYILFICAGAFHISKVEDLIPEFQGRFPIRVELQNLNADDFYKILTVPKNALTKQYAELLKVDNINLIFDDSALKRISEIAERDNETSENLGARRLHTIMERLLEEISFNANGEHPLTDVIIDAKYVDNAFKDTNKKYDLKKYVL